MESIRCHFFNGIELNSKKAIWVKWNKVLAAKDRGGLGNGVLEEERYRLVQLYVEEVG
ncbi:hypothetical protein Tco_1096260, partial [Tanacetum coccineum]